MRLVDMRMRRVKDPKPEDVSDDLDPMELLSQWLRWAPFEAPAKLRTDTVALLAAVRAAQRRPLRGPQDL